MQPDCSAPHVLQSPSWLTLEHKIGGFAPASCEISKSIEGPGSLPCEALEFKIWLVNMAGPGGWEYFSWPKAIWLADLFLVFMWLVALFLLSLAPTFVA